MSITKNVFKLNKMYDLINAGCIVYQPQTSCTLWAWGFNAFGQLGQNDRIPYSSPVQIPGTNWSCVVSGGTTNQGYTLALKTDGTLWGTGENTSVQGQALGDGTATNRSSPVQIPGTTWSSISAGCSISYGLKSDNSLWSWGRNADGQLGLNFDCVACARSGSPNQIPGSWSAIFAGTYAAYAIKSAGTLWAWGCATYGEIAGNSRVHRSSPVQIPGTAWVEIAAGSGSVRARKTDGSLWSWGNNFSGELGIGTTVHRSSPVQVPGLAWASIGGNFVTGYGIKTDNSLWSWGDGTLGQLGSGSVGQAAGYGGQRSSPVVIPGSVWRLIEGGRNAMGFRTNGTLFVWGDASGGAMGNNSTVSRSSPVQVPGTTWTCGHTIFRNESILALKCDLL